MKVRIKSNSFIARIAGKTLKEKRMAVVLGKTIYLWNANSEDLLNNKKWLCHEATHIRQFQEYGSVRFLFLYLKENFKNGYADNRLEVEARSCENDEAILSGIEFVLQGK